jgi:hypothetical protein
MGVDLWILTNQVPGENGCMYCTTENSSISMPRMTALLSGGVVRSEYRRIPFSCRTTQYR